MAADATATTAGLCALLIWASSVALMRSLSESVGLLTGPALACLLGGLLSLLWTRLSGGSLSGMLRLPPKYLFGCGALFVAYNLGIYLAIGTCATRSQALVIGLVNYLWPSLTVAFSVPLLGRKAGARLAAGVLLAASGTAVAVVGGGALAAADLAFWSTPRGLFALASAAAAAVAWALYSNLARRWGDPEQGAVGFFVLATAAALGLLLRFRPETPHWTAAGVFALCAIGVASMTVAYALWDLGVRRGDQALLGVCSYFVPVASTLISAAYLSVRPGWHVIGGCGLVVAGVLLSRERLPAGRGTS